MGEFLTFKTESSSSRTEDQIAEFRRLSKMVAALAEQCGTQIIPFSDPSLPLFSQLPLEAQKAGNTKLSRLIDVYSQARDHKTGEFDHRLVVWMALKNFELIPPSDFMDRIAEGNVVELYSSDGIQLFSNFRFFDLCSYTLEELASRDWLTLWKRDPDSLAQMQSIVAHVLSSETESTVTLSGVVHTIEESNSPLKLTVDYELLAMCPLWDRKSKVKIGFAVVESGNILTPPLSPEEEEIALLRHTQAAHLS